MIFASVVLVVLVGLASNRPAPPPPPPPPPPGAVEGDLVEVDGETWQVHGGRLYTLDDPALEDADLTITVTGSRADKKKKKVVRTDVVTSTEIGESGARTLGDVLEAQAGIQVNSQFGLGQQITLDGIDGRGVLVLIDGRPATGRVNDAVDVGRLPVSASTIERIEIVRGPMSALYGSEALGGVVNIVTKKPSTAPGGEIELGGQVFGLADALWSNLGLHGRGGAGPVAARIDVTAAALPGFDRDLDGRNEVPDRRNLGVHTEVATAILDDISFRGVLDGSLSQAVIRSPEFSDRARNSEWSAAAVVATDLAPLIEGETSAGPGELSLDLRIARFQHVSDKLPDGGEEAPPSFCKDGGLFFDPDCPAPPDPRTDAGEDEARLELKVTEPIVERAFLAEELTVAAGAVLVRQRVRRLNRDGEDALPGGSSKDSFSLYGEAMWRPVEWLALLPGARADAFTPANNGSNTAATPKIAARVDGPWGLAARAQYGRGFRFPSFGERFLLFDHSELGYIVQGDPSLRPEQSHGFRLEGMWDPIDEVSLSVEGYLNLIDDLITEKATDELGADGVTPLFTYGNIAHAYTSGVNTRAAFGPFLGVRLDVGYQYLINAVDASLCPVDNPYFCNADEGASSLPLRAAHSLSAGARWRFEPTSTVLFARAQALSDRPLGFDDAAGPVIAHGYVQVSAGVRQPLFDTAEITLSVDDINDAYDAQFGPKPGRRVTFLVRVWQ